MTTISETYKLIGFDKQASPSAGITAGMWAVVRTTEAAIAFTDTRAEAEELLALIAKSTKAPPA